MDTKEKALEEWLGKQNITLRKSTIEELKDYGEDWPTAIIINGVFHDTSALSVDSDRETLINEIVCHLMNGCWESVSFEEIKKYFNNK